MLPSFPGRPRETTEARWRRLIICLERHTRVPWRPDASSRPPTSRLSKHPSSVSPFVDARRTAKHSTTTVATRKKGWKRAASVECKRTRNEARSASNHCNKDHYPRPRPVDETRKINSSQQRQNDADPPPRAAPPPGAQPSGRAAAADAATPSHETQKRFIRKPQGRGRRDREEPRLT